MRAATSSQEVQLPWTPRHSCENWRSTHTLYCCLVRGLGVSRDRITSIPNVYKIIVSAWQMIGFLDTYLKQGPRRQRDMQVRRLLQCELQETQSCVSRHEHHGSKCCRREFHLPICAGNEMVYVPCPMRAHLHARRGQSCCGSLSQFRDPRSECHPSQCRRQDSLLIIANREYLPSAVHFTLAT